MAITALTKHLYGRLSDVAWERTGSERKEIYRAQNEYIYQTPPFVGGFLNGKYFLLNYHPTALVERREWISKKTLVSPAPVGQVLADKLIVEIIKRISHDEAQTELVQALKNYRPYIDSLHQSLKESVQTSQAKKRRLSDEELSLVKAREEKTNELKEKREAERQRKKEEKQRRKAENLRLMQEQQAQKAEKEKRRLFEKRIEYLQKHDVAPVAEEKEGHPLFYGSLNGKVYYILLNTEKPLFQFVNAHDTMPIAPTELPPILEQIDACLNKDGRLDSVLETIGSLYLTFTHNKRIVSQNDVINSFHQMNINTLTRS